jgi:hypothetical protein
MSYDSRGLTVQRKDEALNEVNYIRGINGVMA